MHQAAAKSIHALSAGALSITTHCSTKSGPKAACACVSRGCSQQGGGSASAGKTAAVINRPPQPWCSGLCLHGPGTSREGGAVLGESRGFVLPPAGPSSQAVSPVAAQRLVLGESCRVCGAGAGNPGHGLAALICLHARTPPAGAWHRRCLATRSH